MSNKDLEITIGITAFNEGILLIDSWKSVLQQTSENWEAVMVLDGGGDKKTQRLFESISHKKLRKFRNTNNLGPYPSRKKSIKFATNDWYLHLDADDLLNFNAVRELVSIIKLNPKCEYIYGPTEYFDEKNKQVKYPSKNIEDLCLQPLFIPTAPFKISLLNRIGGFCDELFINADWDFWLSVFEQNIKGAYTDTTIYKRRYRFNNVGHTHIDLRPAILEKIIQRHPIYFNSDNRKNIARFNVYQKLARYYKSIGDRKNATKYAKEALKYGDSIPAFDIIFQEEKMSFLRYKLRRLGRLV